MKNQFPALLEYFYYDILRDEARFSVKKLFGEWGIFENDKIFAICHDGEIFFRKNTFLDQSQENQFFYLGKWKKVFLPYFRVDEAIFDDRELLEKYIKTSIWEK